MQSRGLAPVAVVVAQGVHHAYETDLCAALVNKGVNLLNVTPCYARASGRIVVDVEQEGRSYVGDIVHFDVPLTAKHPPFDLVEPAAAKAFRRMADALDPPKGKRRPSPYERETAVFMAYRLVHVVVEGKSWWRGVLFSGKGSPLGAAAALAIRRAKRAVRSRRMLT